ncbi:hypothetical protein CBF31_03155 [Vagococcus fessus]|uniref:HTH tetR-type domain-containing protein n=2 Tax=Vagococcus fessus TaxID=120370 RepID=A0A430ACT8_9ENTE|nr:hypothetical protein CBF31_03155 [Vagococcus fessus]
MALLTRARQTSNNQSVCLTSDTVSLIILDSSWFRPHLTIGGDTMPKETFFNLPIEKKNIVLDSALKEFSKASIHEASVANIVRDSQISRGSFYKYFEDIEDLYHYLYHTVTGEAHGTVMDAIKKAEGDLFLGLETYLIELVHAYSNDKYHDYFKIVTLNLSYTTEHKLAKKDERATFSKTAPTDFTKMMKTDHLKITSQQDLLDFFKVLVPVIHQCLNDYFANDWDQTELLDQYNRRIKWLKHGILKDE